MVLTDFLKIIYNIFFKEKYCQVYKIHNAIKKNLNLYKLQLPFMYFYILILLYNLFIVDIIKNKINKVVNFIDDFLYSLIIM